MQDNKAKIRGFISKHIRAGELADDTDVFSSGFVNSLFAMQLVMFVEKEFDVAVEDEDLAIENFRSINAIYDLVERKWASQATA